MVYNIAKETSQRVTTIVSTKQRTESEIPICTQTIIYLILLLSLDNTLTTTKTLSLRCVSILSFDTDTKE